jgi:alpha-glucosidase
LSRLRPLCLPIYCILGCILGLAVVAPAASVDYVTHGVAIHINAIASNIFRISIDAEHKSARPIKSIYLNPALPHTDVGTLSKGSSDDHSLSTSAGTLKFDPASDTVSLQNLARKLLLPPALLATPMVISDKPAIAIHLGWPQDRPFAVYACGNGADGLLQYEVKARVGNGVAVEPFFFAPAGFATFVVGADANAPAQCDGKVEHDAVTWLVPGTSADVYLIIAPQLGDASRALLQLTGTPPVPPRWTFGYLQSRWGWKDKAYIDDTLQQFLVRKLPIDAFIFDFEWYTKFPDYKVPSEGVKDFSDFAFNPDLFPEPAAQVKQLHDAGVHFVGIRKPRLGDSDTLKKIRSKGWGFVGGSEYNARALRLDLPAMRHWYANQIKPLLRDGIDGWWDDEGEYTYTAYTYWDMAEREALDDIHPHARLWTLDRAFQPGTSRFGAAAWTGDIRANWDTLRKTPTTLLNWSIAGMPYCACDIGGYGGETTPELLVRWMQAGTFFPVMRTHSNFRATPHFPWLFGPDAESAIRKTLNLRYQLIPYLYSLAHQTYETGEPIMRPLLMQYPADPALADLSNEWLLGENLLAAPVLAPGNSRTIVLPDDSWYDFATGQPVTSKNHFTLNVPFDSVPVYIRAGTILPLAPIVQHTRDLPGGPLDVHIYPGRDGKFALVEDDGSTTDYLKGHVRRTEFTWNDQTKTVRWVRTGSYDGTDCFRSMKITLHDGVIRSVTQIPLSRTGAISLR